MKNFRVPSSTEQGKYYIVSDNGEIECTCPALKECKHIRRYRSWKFGIQGNPERCFYSGDTRNLEEHHLMRGEARKFSLTIWLTHWIHQKATWDKEFELHLQDLFFNEPIHYNLNMNIQFKALIKDVSLKNLISGDKGVQFTLYTDKIGEGMKLASIKPDGWVRVEYENTRIYCFVKNVSKSNFKDKDDRVEIKFEAMPAEAVNVAALGVLGWGTEVDVIYEADTNYGV